MLQQFDPRNKNIKVWVGHRLVERADAKVSVFDSSVQGGDAVWEGMRVYENGVFCLERHLDRLEDSARAMAFESIPTRASIKSAIKATLEANGMTKDTHIRLTLTRGEKITSGMDPRLNQSGPTLIVLAEWKPPVYDNETGIRIMTSTIRRNSPMHVDSKIHHNNLINNILAKIQANHAGVDSALMLDNLGFISLTELYAADEAFGTGSMGELTPIVEVDGRVLVNRSQSNLTAQLIHWFEGVHEKLSTPLANL